MVGWDWRFVGLALVAVAAVLLSLIVAAQREYTALESVLFQLFIALAGVVASFLVGRQSAQDAAERLIRPHVRKAFRRTLRLYSALEGLAKSIEDRRQVLIETATSSPPMVSMDSVGLTLDVFSAQVVGPLGTTADAMEDWRDVLPEEVATLESESRKRQDASRRRLVGERRT